MKLGRDAGGGGGGGSERGGWLASDGVTRSREVIRRLAILMDRRCREKKAMILNPFTF